MIFLQLNKIYSTLLFKIIRKLNLLLYNGNQIMRKFDTRIGLIIKEI